MSLRELFSQIANAIRTKTGSTGSIVANNFPSAILGIETGGSGEMVTTTTKEFDLLPSQTLGFNDMGFWQFNDLDGSRATVFTLIAGENYKVVWDGVSYSCTAIYNSSFSGTYIGNPNIVGIDTATEHPFLLFSGVGSNEGTGGYSNSGDNTSHTARIYQTLTIVE